MDIISAKYENSGFLINGIHYVPNDYGNADFNALQEWLAAGGTIDPEFTQAELVAQQVEALRLARDSALAALIYDLGDGRVMQTRPQDEMNLRTAIDTMTRKAEASRSWFAANNTKITVTLAEVQAAWEYGQDQADAIWSQFITDVDTLLGGA